MQTDDDLTRFAAQGARRCRPVPGRALSNTTARTSGMRPMALIAAVYERAQQLGLPRVYWNTHETNQIAMRLYDKVAERPGFVMYRKAF
ncbi:N-acetyltransferase [Serratia marcescens]|nr:hypothetical protein [Serratia marcescens]WOX41590.1 hypothetical protein R3983_09520 [Serratia marcescens]